MSKVLIYILYKKLYPTFAGFPYAKLELWQADRCGNYSNPRLGYNSINHDYNHPNRQGEEYDCRSTVTADSTGLYSFETGRYCHIVLQL